MLSAFTEQVNPVSLQIPIPFHSFASLDENVLLDRNIYVVEISLDTKKNIRHWYAFPWKKKFVFAHAHSRSIERVLYNIFFFSIFFKYFISHKNRFHIQFHLIQNPRQFMVAFGDKWHQQIYKNTHRAWTIDRKMHVYT